MTTKVKERSGTQKIINALNSEVRWHLMEVLIECAGEMTLAEIVPVLDSKLPRTLSGSTVAEHLNTLIDAGLVACRKDAQNYYVCSQPRFFEYLSALCKSVTQGEDNA